MKMVRIKGQSGHFSCQIGLMGSLQDFSTVLGCGYLRAGFERPVNNLWKSRMKSASLLSREKMTGAEFLYNRLKRRIHISFTPMKKYRREAISLNRCMCRPFERAFFIHHLWKTCENLFLVTDGNGNPAYFGVSGSYPAGLRSFRNLPKPSKHCAGEDLEGRA